jgi:hypothetical protein
MQDFSSVALAARASTCGPTQQLGLFGAWAARASKVRRTWTGPIRQHFLVEIVSDAEELLELVRGARGILVPGSDQDKALVAAAEVLARILEGEEGGPRLKRRVAPKD